MGNHGNARENHGSCEPGGTMGNQARVRVCGCNFTYCDRPLPHVTTNRIQERAPAVHNSRIESHSSAFSSVSECCVSLMKENPQFSTEEELVDAVAAVVAVTEVVLLLVANRLAITLSK